MDRRSFIRISTTGGLLLCSGPLLLSCTDDVDLALEPWAGPSPLLSEEDVRLRIVSYGLLSPSFKNTQPWWVDIKGDGTVIRPEAHRIPATLDPTGRQTRISLGAFIETLSLASSSFGYRMIVDTYPDADAATAMSSETRVAVCRLDPREDASVDPLFHSIIRRRTNRTPFYDTPLDTAHAKALEQTSLPGMVSLTIATGPESVRDISGIAREATLEELSTADLRTAALEHLRFTEDQVRESRDGMMLWNTGLSAFDRAWFRVQSGVGLPTGPAATEQLSALLDRQTGTAAAWGAIITPGDSALDHISSGRSLMRMHLQATQLGLAFQPFSRAVESRTASKKLHAAMAPQSGHIQCLFRLGYGPEVPPSPRRSLFEIVRI